MTRLFKAGQMKLPAAGFSSTAGKRVVLAVVALGGIVAESAATAIRWTPTA